MQYNRRPCRPSVFRSILAGVALVFLYFALLSAAGCASVESGDCSRDDTLETLWNKACNAGALSIQRHCAVPSRDSDIATPYAEISTTYCATVRYFVMGRQVAAVGRCAVSYEYALPCGMY
mgnify:CR=1 FL=1